MSGGELGSQLPSARPASVALLLRDGRGLVSRLLSDAGYEPSCSSEDGAIVELDEEVHTGVSGWSR